MSGAKDETELIQDMFFLGTIHDMVNLLLKLVMTKICQAKDVKKIGSKYLPQI